MKTTSRLTLLTLLPLIGGTSMAASTDLANQPLSTTQVNARPNLMFILDDSGSMASDYMPELINSWSSYTSTYGYRSYQCNGLQYNPTNTYAAPKTPLGASYPNMSLTSVWSDGYQPSFASSPTAVSSSTSLDMSYDATSGVSKTLTVSSTSGFSNGMTVVIQSGSSNAHWMMGKITAVSSTSKTLTVSVTFSTANNSVTYNSWTVGVASGSDLSGTGTGTYYYAYSGSQTAMNYTYDATGTVIASNFYNECKTASSTASSVFTKVYANSLTASQQTNYANWYAYYRKRILAMRATAGRAFSGLTDNFRVGFTVISDTDAVSGSNGFVPVDTFIESQKISFFKSMYSATPNSSTPLRGALSKIGRYYANSARGQTGHLVSGQTIATPDPVQYACQRNYTLLSTDGYWNTGDEDSSKGYGPYKLDGTTTVGQMDGLDNRPQYDGSVTSTTITYSVGTQTDSTSALTKVVTTHPLGAKTVTNCSTATANFFYTKYTCSYTTTPGFSVQQQTSTSTRHTSAFATQTETVIYTNGQITSDKFSPTTPTQTSSYTDDAYSTPVTTSTPWAASGSTTNGNKSCTTSLFNSCSGYVAGITTTYATDSTNTTNVTAVLQSTGAPVNFKTQSGTSTTTSGGSTNSLADVAEYYYATPFRTSSTVNCITSPTDANCKGDLSPAGLDTATYQHMTTFTLGLGVNGVFKYDANYLTQQSGDYYNVKIGKDSSGNAVNWSSAYDTAHIDNDVAGKIDDLWHAAVNGRGQYFSSSDSDSLTASLNSVLTTIIAASGYGGSAAASSLKPLLGSDTVFLASYTTQTWNGDVKAYLLEQNSAGEVLPITMKWSASDLLTARTYSDRNILYYGTKAVGASRVRSLVSFNYTNLTADGLNTYFDNFCNTSPSPQQCASLGSTYKTTANSGANLVNFLRGERVNEISPGTPDNPYRQRASALGDVINASPVFVGAPPFKYADSGYSTFVSNQASRKKTIYAAANDGMLHAFSADTSDGGTERWAFVPTAVMPNMFHLADSAYKDNHLYFVDGTPVVGDVQDATVGWRTILVGGLNKGGKAYYALDVTDPDSPSMLWQFDTSTDADLGYTFGNPIITKIKDQSSTTGASIWVVIFSTGYNNNSGSGTGVGAIYIVNANTGALIRKIRTTVPDTVTPTLDVAVGNTTTPNGLSKINAWIDSETDNSATRIYGADLLGNVWRFDLNGTYAPANKSLLLAQLATSTRNAQGQTVLSNAQPVTARPELAEVSYGNTKYPVVLIGTGRYLGQSDLTDTSSQSVYAIKDPLTSTGWGAIQGDSRLVTQTFVTSADGKSRTIQTPVATVDWSTKIGWTIALPTSKERVAIDMNLQYSTLGFISAIPEGTACSPSGKSWAYFLSVNNGAGSQDSTVVGNQISSGLGTGMTWFDLGNGNSTVLVLDDKQGVHDFVPPISSTATNNPPKRTSWRELVN
jgi:type IV pilus assembly protein PilY1